MSMYTSEFDEFLRPSTPDQDDSFPQRSFDFNDPSSSSSSGGQTSNFFNFSTAASPPAGSSSSQSYSPPSSTTSGLPTEDELFGLMNGGSGGGGDEGGACFGGMSDVFSFADGMGGAQIDGLMGMGGGGGGGLDFSGATRPPSTEFLDLDPFFQFGQQQNALPSPSNSNQTHNFLQQQANNLSFLPDAGVASDPLSRNPPIPSFLLSHINSTNLFAQSDPLFAPNLNFNTNHTPSQGSSSNHSSAAPSLSGLVPTPSEPAPTPTATKRKLSSSSPSEPKTVQSSSGSKVSDHNAIERKYRDNINDGFTRLRDSVPVLRVLFGTSTPTTLPLDTPSPITGLIDGMPKETKQGKATVLGAAREYIWMLQRERAVLTRSVEFLEARMSEQEKQAWRNAFESSEQSVQLDPYLTSITYPYSSSDSASPSASSLSANSPNSEPSKPPPRKRAKPAVGLKKKGAKAELVSDGGKVLLGVVASVSLFGGAERLDLASEASGVPSPEGSTEGSTPGRVMGMTRRAVGGVAARTGGWSLGWKVLLGLVICVLVLPALRRLVLRMFRSRNEERVQRLEEIVGREDVECEVLRRELGAPSGVRRLMGGIVSQWMKGLAGRWLRFGGGQLVEIETKGWEKVAEKQIVLPTDLKSYLITLYAYLRLANLSSRASASSPRTLSLLSLLSVSLAGGDITPAASSLWASAQAALPSNLSRPEDRAMAEVLELTLSDVLAIAPEAFSTPSNGKTISPLESIASSLALRDILHVWQTLFASFAPPSTQSSPSIIPPTILVALPSIFADRSRKALLSSEIASLVASTTPGSEAHELALVCMGGWSLLVREEEGVKWSLGRLAGQGIHRSLGAGAKALLAVGGVVSPSSSAEGDGSDEEDASNSTPSSSPFNSTITNQINTLSSFLITYQALVLSLSTLTTSKANGSTAKPKSFPTLLPQTLHLRALLNSPELESEGAVDEDAKERFVDGLYGLGRWSVGWRDVGEEDSGFSE